MCICFYPDLIHKVLHMAPKRLWWNHYKNRYERGKGSDQCLERSHGQLCRRWTGVKEDESEE